MNRGALLLIPLLAACHATPDARAQAGDAEPCEGCGAFEAPANLGWDIRIAGPDEPGEPLTVSGVVYRPDGRTPAPGVILYLYHTNERGVYPKRGNETGMARRHGYLRGWLRTDAQGRYRFTTIRPASYPSRAAPQHIHVTVLEPGRPEYWIDDFLFDDDPLLTPGERARLRNLGGSGILRPGRQAGGSWRATRNIVLPTPEESR
ncbi:MAG TPA: hypothetical protein VFS20_32965 [Longimicrobium sp.]|nr:hypothetical protein [Longimicrobium sp.]